MAFASFLNDRCDIYHLRREQEDIGYGIPPNTAHTYPDEPDETNVPCHFNRRGGWGNLVQSDPMRMLAATVKLNLPVGTDVRLNDRIVNIANGATYTAGPPMDIRGHHIAVELQRIGAEREL